MAVMPPWEQLQRNESTRSSAEWAGAHALGLERDGGWWDPQLNTMNVVELDDYVQACECDVIETIALDDGPADEWEDRFYLTVAATLGPDAAEAMFLWGTGEEDGEVHLIKVQILNAFYEAEEAGLVKEVGKWDQDRDTWPNFRLTPQGRLVLHALRSIEETD